MSAFEKIQAAWKRFWQKNKRTKLFILSIIATAIFVLSGWELFSHFDAEFFVDHQIPIVDQMDNYAWIPLGLGGLLMISAWLYFHDHNKHYKRFHELMDTDSKANFIRNIDEIEECAIQLGPSFETQVIDKRKQFKVKTR
ncbi:MAG: DUF3198 domain-containing protein [Candidatus Thermoplasmatota archaeon]|nr:DUF3198 domain-containing protein [Candidatus Thermoplasmatota archaeon]